MAPYMLMFYVGYLNLKSACAMLKWSGRVVPHPLLKQAWAVYGCILYMAVYCIPIRELGCNTLFETLCTSNDKLLDSA